MKSIQLITTLIVLNLVVACGGGGGGSDDSPPPVESKTFTISLDNVNITRTSNGETVAVDTASVSTGTLTYRP